MQEVLIMLNKYSGGYPYMGLFFASLIFFFVACKKEREYWFYPNLVVLLVILNPFVMYFLTRYLLVGGALGVFWRTWWIIPIPVMIAIMFTKVLDFVKGRGKVVVTVLLCLTIALSGQFIFIRDNFYRTQNMYQLPNEILWISGIIEEDLGEQDPEENRVVAVYEIAWRLRLYNPEIRMQFGRTPRSDTGREISSNINDATPDFEAIEMLLRDLNVSYLVIDNLRLESLGYYNPSPEDVGYILIGDTGYYSVFRVTSRE